MKTQLESTGERMIEDAYAQTPEGRVILMMHLASYGFAEKYCNGKDVLDLGCGSGYGTARIAGVARSACGVDVSKDAVAFAQARHASSNLAYRTIEADSPLPFDDSKFDVVLSFQVIEHVKDDSSYLLEARRVLRPRGIIIVITPDRRHRLLPWQRPWNRWHLREYSRADLEEKVGHVFGIEESLRLGAAWETSGIEIRRCRKLMWLTLPLTLPFIPERLRLAGLNLLHSMRKAPEIVRSIDETPVAADPMDLSKILIERDPPYSMNLVLVARKQGQG
ncbi:class I SAM-dependent methyltransferase [Pseudoxanthomonas sp. 22568]|uniref:class I SAM-dependent methyltransferase n=1 Tax=Pseudoxanthomonas sp. 22568 TaxID=3453945 RepID=UPI003F83F18D